MDKDVMNRNGFEQIIRSQVGEFQEENLGEEKGIKYTITEGRFKGFQFLIGGPAEEGLRVVYPDRRLRRRQEFNHIYKRSDAYKLLLKGILDPNQIIYRDANCEEPDLNATLNRQVPSYVWEPAGGISDVPDADLEDLLYLLQTDFVYDCRYDAGNELCLIRQRQNGCKQENLRQLMLSVRGNYFGGKLDYSDSYRGIAWEPDCNLFRKCSEADCPYGFCPMVMCAYLQYAYERGTLHQLLRERREYRARIHRSVGPYSFAWEPKDGLRTVDERTFRLAEQMVDRGLVEVGTELDGETHVVIRSRDCQCGGDEQLSVTTSCMMSCGTAMADPNGPLRGNMWTCTPMAELRTCFESEICAKCDLRGGCVMPVAGYIAYLRNAGLNDQIRQDREWYHNHSVDQYAQPEEFEFRLPDNLFLDVPDAVFENAQLLQENNYVSISRRLQADETGVRGVQIHAMESAVTVTDMAELKQRLTGRTLNRSVLMRFGAEASDRFERVEPSVRHIALAAYIDYLKRMGRFADYLKLRDETARNIEASFHSATAEIPELEKVLAIAQNDNESNLCCVIEGERSERIDEIVQNIAGLLAQSGKIEDASARSMSFEELSSSMTMFQSYGQGTAHSEDFAVYFGLEPRQLYVLEGVEEFLFRLQQTQNHDGSRESHLVELLGRYNPGTYIIVRADAQGARRFLELSPQIKFLFGSNVIPIASPSSEKLFAVYCENLSAQLKAELAKAPDFREVFLDYLAMNRKLLPLRNEELAKYLANFANNHRQLILPPDLYRKQSAREMLSSIIGMENVKKTVNEFEKYALFLKRAEMDGMAMPKNNMHMIFTGNPGTGKTMIARIIAQMLFDFGIVAENKLVEVERKDLVAGYVGQTAIKTAEIVEKAMNGVLFVDEAYALVPKDSGNDFGAEAIATLIKAMEDHKDKLVVIFAGYEKEMKDFLNINPGVASRIGYTFHFDDYTAEELLSMFRIKLEGAGFRFGEEIEAPAREICEHFVHKKNFGNGRFVGKLVQRVTLKHAARELAGEEIRRITCEDIPTIEEMVSTDVVTHRDFEEQLAAFIGMNNVKSKVRQFARFVRFQQAAKAAGANIPAGNMHMIFTGNPGTGKTTIARIMVDMLHDIGIIRENKLVEVERKDLVAEYVGQTAAKTAAVIDRAMDGVLFIDEAYTLAPEDAGNDFGAEAIATLIKAMEDHKGDLIVIFAGYKDEMRRFLRVNPGIESRIGNTFHFDDYKPEELLTMYRRNMERSGFTVGEDALKQVKILLEYFAGRKNFGNGRFVGRLQQETLLRHSQNVTEDSANLLYIDAGDIPSVSDLNNTAPATGKSKALDSIIGMQSVKEKMKEFEQTVNFRVLAREHGLTIPSSNMHMIFTGNPGTGKTTIARIIAQKLYGIGVIKENKLVETERRDLVAGYVGQTAQKVAEVVEKAMGGVLFVDEAYTLIPQSPSDFGGEAIATLIKAMEDHKDDLVVIFAGYRDEMAEFLQVNPGIASRIGFTFHFEDYTASELRQIFTAKLEANGFRVTEQAGRKAEELFAEFCLLENFGNGRFADRIVQSALALHAGHFRMDALEVIDEQDIPDAQDVAIAMGAQA